MLAKSLKLSTQSFEHLQGPQKAHAATQQEEEKTQQKEVIYIHAPEEPEEEGKRSSSQHDGPVGDAAWDLSMDYFAD